jgi:hypothetical protein
MGAGFCIPLVFPVPVLVSHALAAPQKRFKRRQRRDGSRHYYYAVMVGWPEASDGEFIETCGIFC